MMGDLLEDEIVSINAIYTEDTLSQLSLDPLVYSLALPGEYGISLRFEFPSDYPDAPPCIVGTQSVGDSLPKGTGSEVVDLARTVLCDIYTTGSPCIYDLVEELSSRLESILPTISETESTAEAQNEEFGGQTSSLGTKTYPSDKGQDLPDAGPPWAMSELLTEKKSIFVARAAAVRSREEAESFLAHLLATNKPVSQATHNITAWRIRGQGNTTYQDCDDDGESAAGGRLLHLLQLMDAWNVMVVVSRWYGGVHLGPARFRLINTVAREAVVNGGFTNNKASNADKTTDRKQGKR